MSKKRALDAVKNLEKAKAAADEALKPYGFRLCNADNMTIDTKLGMMYVNCKLVFLLKR